MRKREPVVRVGIGGWEHEDFSHTFYPDAATGPLEKLAFTAHHFDAVEVRCTFWDATLDPSDAAAWAAAVEGNGRFRFTVKLHRSFTHTRELRAGIARNVRGILQELARHDRLGALLVQFPYSFTNTGAHRYHLTKVAELFTGFPTRVEFRHDSWHGDALPALLEEHGLLPVNADLPRINHLMPFFAWTAGDSAYIRLHGRNERGWLLNGLDTRYDYLYNDREVREIVRRVELVREKGLDVTVIANNTAGGKAVATALQLRSALHGGQTLEIPPATLAAFPRLKAIADPAAGIEFLFGNGKYRRAV